MADNYKENEAQQPVVTAQGRYDELQTERSPALERARECSMLTIPSLIPPEGTSDSSKLPTPFQSVGARGVNNLAAKLMLALFPPGSRFFRLKVDTFYMDKLKEKAGSDDPTGEVEQALGKAEDGIMTRFEKLPNRPVLAEAKKHLIVAGNALLQMLKDGSLKFHSLANYVCKRDVAGEPVEIIVREGLSRRTLPPEVRAIVEAQSSSEDPKKSTTDTIWLYTWLCRQDDGRMKVSQEVLGQPVPGTSGFYPKGKSAWLPLRWNAVTGSDYGRGHCEEYLGDLHSLESLSQSIVEFAANAAKVVWLVDEGGVTSKKKLADAASGAVIDGNSKDVTTLMMEKFADFQVVKATADEIEHRLEQAFLLNSSIQRQAERVTAEEIRYMAGELEQALGGTYSILGQELQRPLVTRLMLVLQRERLLPALPDNIVNPQIITGLDGLGRSSDLTKLDLLLQGASAMFGPEAVAEYFSPGWYINRRATALGIDVQGGVRTEEQVQQARAAQAQQATEDKVAPAIVKGMSDQAKAAAQQPQQQ